MSVIGWNRPEGAARGFTLIEVSIVVVVIGILAVASIPALRSVTDINQAGAKAEVERRVVLVRSLAIASGVPHGVRLDLERSSMTLLTIRTPGTLPEMALDALGNRTGALSLGAQHPGAAITSFVNGDGRAGTGTLWFGYAGYPQIRDEDGLIGGVFTSSARVGLAGGYTIGVSAAGAIER